MHVFQERLQICVNQAGGFRCLSVRSGISAMQLKRYKHGVSNPTLKKLEAIALASGVKPSWLIGGKALLTNIIAKWFWIRTFFCKLWNRLR